MQDFILDNDALDEKLLEYLRDQAEQDMEKARVYGNQCSNDTLLDPSETHLMKLISLWVCMVWQ